MIKENAQKILKTLKDTDLVLEIGAWAEPFNRANFVIDIMPYETRGLYGSSGGDKEYFSKTSWIQRDICSKEPFPFKDKELDFVICSHTLEDIRDPIWVCQEMMRISKKGYIETPSRLWESTLGVESNKYCGFLHHRWFVEIKDVSLFFTAKNHLLHSYWRYHFPKNFFKNTAPKNKFMSMFWETSFEVKEQLFVELDDIKKDLSDFVANHQAYSSYRYRLSNLKQDYKNSGFRKRLFPFINWLEKPIKMIFGDL